MKSSINISVSDKIFVHLKRYLLLAVSILMLTSSWLLADQEVKVVTSAGRVIKNLANLDGTGFVYDMYRLVFGAAGVEFRHIPVDFPYARAVNVVKTGEADVMLASTKKAWSDFGLISPTKFPWVHVNMTVLIYKKGSINWSGYETLEDKSLVTARGFFSNKRIKSIYGVELKIPIHHVNKSSQALVMLKLERKDITILPISGVHSAFLELKQSEQTFNPAEYELRAINRFHLYPGFSPTERGKKVASLWSQGFKNLHKEGRLKEIKQLSKKWKINELYWFDYESIFKSQKIEAFYLMDRVLSWEDIRLFDKS